MVKISISGKPHISYQGPVLRKIRRQSFIFYPLILEEIGLNIVVSGVKDNYKFQLYHGQTYSEHLKDKSSNANVYWFPKDEYDVDAEKSYFKRTVGGGINVSKLIFSQGKLNKEGLYVLFNIIRDLNKITGLLISVNSEGNLVCDNIVNKGTNKSSAKARKYVQLILKSTKTIYISNDNTKNTQGGGIGNVNMNADQIDNNIQAIKNAGISELTFGFGMSFLHESLHTATGTLVVNPSAKSAIGDPPKTTPKATGPTVDKINEFRNELGLATRLSYFWEQTSPNSSAKMNWKVGSKRKSITKTKMSSQDQAARRDAIKKLIDKINVFGYGL